MATSAKKKWSPPKLVALKDADDFLAYFAARGDPNKFATAQAFLSSARRAAVEFSKANESTATHRKARSR